MRFPIAIALAGLTLMGAARADAPDPRTARLYRAKCAACHGDDGRAQTEQGKKMGIADMTAAAWQKEFTDEKIRAAIESGLKREKASKQQEMEAYKNTLRPEQIGALVGVLRGFGK